MGALRLLACSSRMPEYPQCFPYYSSNLSAGSFVNINHRMFGFAIGAVLALRGYLNLLSGSESGRFRCRSGVVWK